VGGEGVAVEQRHNVQPRRQTHGRAAPKIAEDRLDVGVAEKG
jgi:hypothetical protein